MRLRESVDRIGGLRRDLDPVEMGEGVQDLLNLDLAPPGRAVTRPGIREQVAAATVGATGQRCLGMVRWTPTTRDAAGDFIVVASASSGQEAVTLRLFTAGANGVPALGTAPVATLNIDTPGLTVGGYTGTKLPVDDRLPFDWAQPVGAHLAIALPGSTPVHLLRLADNTPTVTATPLGVLPTSEVTVTIVATDLPANTLSDFPLDREYRVAVADVFDGVTEGPLTPLPDWSGSAVLDSATQGPGVTHVSLRATVTVDNTVPSANGARVTARRLYIRREYSDNAGTPEAQGPWRRLGEVPADGGTIGDTRFAPASDPRLPGLFQPGIRARGLALIESRLALRGVSTPEVPPASQDFNVVQVPSGTLGATLNPFRLRVYPVWMDGASEVERGPAFEFRKELKSWSPGDELAFSGVPIYPTAGRMRVEWYSTANGWWNLYGYTDTADIETVDGLWSWTQDGLTAATNPGTYDALAERWAEQPSAVWVSEPDEPDAVGATLGSRFLFERQSGDDIRYITPASPSVGAVVTGEGAVGVGGTGLLVFKRDSTHELVTVGTDPAGWRSVRRLDVGIPHGRAVTRWTEAGGTGGPTFALISTDGDVFLTSGRGALRRVSHGITTRDRRAQDGVTDAVAVARRELYAYGHRLIAGGDSELTLGGFTTRASDALVLTMEVGTETWTRWGFATALAGALPLAGGGLLWATVGVAGPALGLTDEAVTADFAVGFEQRVQFRRFTGAVQPGGWTKDSTKSLHAVLVRLRQDDGEATAPEVQVAIQPHALRRRGGVPVSGMGAVGAAIQAAWTLARALITVPNQRRRMDAVDVTVTIPAPDSGEARRVEIDGVTVEWATMQTRDEAKR